MRRGGSGLGARHGGPDDVIPSMNSLAAQATPPPFMNQAQLNWFTNFIWNIDDDVLCEVYVRGKYRDVNIVGGPPSPPLPNRSRTTVLLMIPKLRRIEPCL